MAGISINSNIISQKARSGLNKASNELTRNYEHLGSGLRINRASDDPAGLAILSGLNVGARVYGQGIRNINDGISALNVAEGTVRQLSDITTRIRELATQAANGAYSLLQRRSLNTEANALVSEFNRLINTTRFNGLNILDGSRSSIAIQSGYGSTGALLADLGTKLSRTVGVGTFQTTTSYATGTAVPTDVDTGDVNGDGILDLVSASQTDGSVSIMLGNGNGTFQTAVTYDTGNQSQNVSLGDVDNDGDLDIAANDYDNDRAQILLNNGNGTFATSVSYLAGDGVTDVVFTDVNNDGKLDLITGARLDLSSNILIGNGNGTFQALVSYGGGGSGIRIVAGDFNGDGRQDYATSYGSLFLNNGNGTFYQASTFSPGAAGNFRITAGDFNNDGYLDVATSATSGSNGMSVFLGKGNGSFQTGVSYTTSGNSFDLEAADFNGDGILDIVVVDNASSKLDVFLGKGDGTFQARVSYATSVSSLYLATGDFNRDGALDIAASNQASGNTIDILLANTAATTTIGQVNINTQAGALSALSDIENTLTRVLNELGSLGSSQSRFNAALNNLVSLRDNYKSAASRIADVDVAAESSKMIQNQVRTQTATALVGQANLQPSIALGLLRDL